MVRRVLMAEESGVRVSGRPRLCLTNGVKVALGSIEMTVETALQCVQWVFSDCPPPH